MLFSWDTGGSKLQIAFIYIKDPKINEIPSEICASAAATISSFIDFCLPLASRSHSVINCRGNLCYYYASVSVLTCPTSYIHTHTLTYIHTHKHTYTHTNIHTHKYTHTHKHTHTNIHTYTHTNIHTHKYTHTYTNTHTNIHTHKLHTH